MNIFNTWEMLLFLEKTISKVLASCLKMQGASLESLAIRVSFSLSTWSIPVGWLRHEEARADRYNLGKILKCARLSQKQTLFLQLIQPCITLEIGPEPLFRSCNEGTCLRKVTLLCHLPHLLKNLNPVTHLGPGTKQRNLHMVRFEQGALKRPNVIISVKYLLRTIIIFTKFGIMDMTYLGKKMTVKYIN